MESILAGEETCNTVPDPSHFRSQLGLHEFLRAGSSFTR
jgi:hypothetical protein